LTDSQLSGNWSSEILPNPTQLTESKASGFRAFTVQNPVNSTRFALSQTHFLSNSDQSGARTNSSEELFPLDFLSVNFVHRLELAGNFPRLGLS
jgi:hypothetical protein